MASRIKTTVWALMCLGSGTLLLSSAAAQTNPLVPGARDGSVSADSGVVDLSFDEPVSLATLVEYVGREMNLSFIYDASVLDGEVQMTIRGPLPVAALEGLLATALRMNGLTVIESITPGIKRIVAADRSHLTLRKRREGDVGPPPRPEAFSVVTRVFSVRNETANDVAQALRPLLANPENLIYSSDASGVVVVADQASVIEQIEELLVQIEGGGRDVDIRVVPLKHAVARDLAEQVTLVMEAKMSASGMAQTDSVRVRADPRTNQLVVSGPREAMAEVVKLVGQLDGPVNAAQAPIRRYKLTNTKAREVLQTLRAVAGLGAGASDPGAGLGGGGGIDAGVGTSSSRGNRGDRDDDEDGGGFRGQSNENDDPRFGFTPRGRSSETDLLETGLSIGTLNGKKLTLAADVNTNSIIVVADAATHTIFEDLIQLLDERRPQVQIEATLVSLNTTDDYSLGVEFGIRDAFESGRLISFSSFGISGITPLVPTLAPAVGAGLTAGLLDSGFADVILQAFKEDGRSRVLSAPTLLVNDNERAVLRSILEEPTTTVTQGEVSDQVSFQGFVEAGTRIAVTPSISEGGYLQLEYLVEVNSFLTPSVDSAAGIPPPRQTDSIGSRVTIPDGHTVVAGGLSRRDFSDIETKVPILGDIPLIGELFKSTNKSDTEITLFVFLKPTILRDDDFADLRALSDPKLREAGLAGNEPWDGPELILD